jgi:hypothetical protein
MLVFINAQKPFSSTRQLKNSNPTEIEIKNISSSTRILADILLPDKRIMATGIAIIRHTEIRHYQKSH